jgi:hypothetical protein
MNLKEIKKEIEQNDKAWSAVEDMFNSPRARKEMLEWLTTLTSK